MLRCWLALAGAALVVTLGACASADAEEPTGAASAPLEVCGGLTTVRGVDVSRYQGDVTWSKVKSAGMTFAFARVSDGTSHIDQKFVQNWKGMKTAGLVRGAYQFFRPGRDPVAQADIVISKLSEGGGLKSGDLPPVLDLEETDGLAAADVIAKAKSWLARIETKLKVKPLVYTGNHMTPVLGLEFGSYALWVPHYGDVTCPRVPPPWKGIWTFWQDSDKGRVAGVNGDVDTNYFNGKREWLLKLTLLRDAPRIAFSELTELTAFESASDDDADFGAKMGDGLGAR